MKLATGWYSERLGERVGVARWGLFGTPVLLFPTAGGDAEEIERMHVVGSLQHLIDAGRIKVYSCDSVAGRTWLEEKGSQRHRAWIQSQFHEFVARELVPAIREDEHLARGEQPPTIWGTSIGENFFETLETPLFAGRLFGRSDTAATRPVAIVNDTLARRFWPDQNPLGKRLHVLGRDEALVEVVGVVATTTVGYPGELPTNAIYFPYRQRPADQMVLLAATAGESAALLKPLQDAIRGIDRAVPVFDAQPIEAFYGERVTGFGTVMLRLVGGMGVMGILLTMVGLYGLVSYSVSRRTREIGIRIAVGATSARILTMVLRQGMTPALAGVVAGLALGIVTTRWMNQLVPFSHHVDAAVYSVAVPLLVAIALGAAFLPARRAARVNPTEALRCE